MSDSRLYSCWFPVPEGKAWPPEWYRRHAAVLEHSARLALPGWIVQVEKIGPPTPRRAALGGNTSSYIYNTHKLERWCQVLAGLCDGDRLLLIDADTMVLRPLDPVWDGDFDVAYTWKADVTRIPINAGVIFLRVNARARAFMEAWWTWNVRLLGDAALHRRYRNTYAGMNQAALGALLENGGDKIARLLRLHCREWNCESATWDRFDPKEPARIVHVKGAMRRALMDPQDRGRGLITPARREIAETWRRLEAGALEEASRG